MRLWRSWIESISASENCVHMVAVELNLLPGEFFLTGLSYWMLFLIILKSEANGRKSTRPVLKHGPRSLTCAQVIGFYET
jgi:hypothetical protein